MTENDRNDAMVALAAKARAWASVALPPSPWGDKHVVWELADALESISAPPEPEWATEEWIAGYLMHRDIHPSENMARDWLVLYPNDSLARRFVSDWQPVERKEKE